MKKIVSKSQMSYWDNYTISEMKVPGVVLMERAALAVCDLIESISTDKNDKIGIICGPGNNGGDGVCIGRILHLKGYQVLIYMLGNPDKYTDQLKDELTIAKNYQVAMASSLDSLNSCKLLVDAIFGIGLSRDVSGAYLDAIGYINSRHQEKLATVIAVDIPSGFDSDTGKTLGSAIIADYTVTFGYIKKGLLLSDCFLGCGQLTLADVGIYMQDDSDCHMIEHEDFLELLPPVKRSDNKGSRGRLLIIAGSESIYGAAYLSAKAAMSAGCGLVKIFTHENNLHSIQENLPEAMYEGYNSFEEEALIKLLSWADTVLIGPGLGADETAIRIMSTTLTYFKNKMVIDADGINILAANKSLLELAKSRAVITPHLKEMSRLVGKTVAEIACDMEECATLFSKEYDIAIDLKNYTSVIAGSSGRYINTTGNEGMATAGSGDVLSGIIAAFVAQGLELSTAAALGAYVHGKAGEAAASIYGKRAMTARHIIEGLVVVFAD